MYKANGKELDFFIQYAIIHITISMLVDVVGGESNEVICLSQRVCLCV